MDDDERIRAQAAFRQVYSGRKSWTWKDPRNCLLLDYWLEALELQPLVVYVYRDPLEVACSLSRRDEMPIEYGLALWERYNQQALHSAHGKRALVIAYSELVASPLEGVQGIADWLRAHDVCNASTRNIKRAVRSIEPGLKHWTGTVDTQTSSECDATLQALEKSRGAHQALTVDVPEYRPEVQRLFDESGTTTRPWIAS